MNRFIFVLVSVFAVMTTASAQVGFEKAAIEGKYLEQFRGKFYHEIVPQVWLEVCRLNREQYPDSNVVRVGDVIKLPLGKHYLVSSEATGNDHMWRASQYFVDMVITPYLVSNRESDSSVVRERAVEQKSTSRPLFDSMLDWLLLIIMVLLVIVIVAVVVIKTMKLTKGQSFVKFPPDFESAADSQVRPIATQALGNAFGSGFEIVGEIERGVMNGTLTVFFADGRRRTEEYENEPGFRARLRFADGTERTVVCRWACFNPVWSASDAEFNGTFTPTGGKPEEIFPITESQANHLTANILDIKEDREPMAPIAEVIPTVEAVSASRSTEKASPVSASEEPKQDVKLLKLSKVQFSREKGLNLEGDIPITIDDLNALISKVQGESKEVVKGS